MPNLSSSDYTTYLKYKAAALAYANNRVPRPIQTVDQAAPNFSIINTYVKTSEAAFRSTPGLASITGANYVRARPPNNVNHPFALSRLSYQDMGPAASTRSIVGILASAPAPGPTGGSLLFTPAGGVPRTAAWLSVAQPAEEMVYDDTQNFTIECFVRAVGTASDAVVFSFADKTDATIQLGLRLVDRGGGSLQPTVTTLGTDVILSDAFIATNAWYHIALVRLGGTLFLFINGVPQNTTPSNSDDSRTNTRPVFIGQNTLSQVAGTEFNGYITNFRWVIGTAVYDRDFTPPTTPLTAIANTKLLLLATNLGTATTDSSTQNLTVTNVGTTWNALTPF